MQQLTYVGPHDAVEVAGQVVAQGESAPFPDALAKSLLEQTDNWQPVKAPAKKVTD